MTCVKVRGGRGPYIAFMELSLKRLRGSRTARVLAVVAALSFVSLLRPYCELAQAAADTAASIQTGERHADGHEHDQPGPVDTCPSLDHMPAVAPDASLLPLPQAPAPALAIQTPNGAISGTEAWRITALVTPPPLELFPLYLRYAHLLI